MYKLRKVEAELRASEEARQTLEGTIESRVSAALESALAERGEGRDAQSAVERECEGLMEALAAARAEVEEARLGAETKACERVAVRPTTLLSPYPPFVGLRKTSLIVSKGTCPCASCELVRLRWLPWPGGAGADELGA